MWGVISSKRMRSDLGAHRCPLAAIGGTDWRGAAVIQGEAGKSGRTWLGLDQVGAKDVVGSA